MSVIYKDTLNIGSLKVIDSEIILKTNKHTLN